MREIKQFTWDYKGLQSDMMQCFVGVGVNAGEAMANAISTALNHGWGMAGLRLPENTECVARVQGEDQGEQFLATLFVSDEALTS